MNILFIGDIVECYDETWIVVELFEDEYGLNVFDKHDEKDEPLSVDEVIEDLGLNIK